MELAETREIKGMDSNKQCKIQKFRAYHAEERFSRARELLRFKAVTRNIVQKALMMLDEISAQEIQGEKPSPSRMEKYFILHHYLDYLNRFYEEKV
jgi:hypothetical protein